MDRKNGCKHEDGMILQTTRRTKHETPKEQHMRRGSYSDTTEGLSGKIIRAEETQRQVQNETAETDSE